jgi:phage terminase Nu1 subunit (DNA packaging protein)
MSTSQAHSDAARRNGSRSNGPVTESGKARSSRNAVKHNLFGSTTLLSPEDRQAFDDLTTNYLHEYSPQTITESHYVREMIDAEWRLTRTRAQAAAIQQSEIDSLPPTTAEPSALAFHRLSNKTNVMSLLLRYETQFRRQYDRSLSQFLDLRKRRLAEAAQSQETAESHSQPTNNPNSSTLRNEPMPAPNHQPTSDQRAPKHSPNPIQTTPEAA